LLADGEIKLENEKESIAVKSFSFKAYALRIAKGVHHYKGTKKKPNKPSCGDFVGMGSALLCSVVLCSGPNSEKIAKKSHKLRVIKP
jgi:hypothetical protein